MSIWEGGDGPQPNYIKDLETGERRPMEPTTTEPVLEAMDKAAQKSMSQVAPHGDWLRGILRAALEGAGWQQWMPDREEDLRDILERLVRAAYQDEPVREQAAEEGTDD